MRICCWTERYWPDIGGISVLVSKLLCSLSNLGHEFVIVTGKDDLDQPDYEEFNKIAIHRFPFHQLTSNRDIAMFGEVGRRLSRLRKEFAPELIHMHDVFPGSMFYMLSLRNSQTPLLLTLHCCLRGFNAAKNSLLGRLLRSSRWVTGCSAAVLKDPQAVMPQITERSSVIYSGVEAPGLQPSPLPFDPPRILCLGRLRSGKGYDLALRAVSLLGKQFPKVRLMISGDGPERKPLEQLAANLGLRDSVDFLGWTDPKFANRQAIWELINRSTVVVMPSRREGAWVEGLGMAAIEGSIMERPIVASRSGGLPEAVEDGQTGLLVEEDDLDGLVTAIATLLEDPSRAEQMGRAGRRRSLDKFDWDKQVVAQYNALYHKLAKEI